MPAAIPIMIGLIAAGTAVQVTGQIKQGNAARKAGDIQQELGQKAGALEDLNAAAAEEQARDAIERGRVEEGRFRAGVRGIIGSQRAGFAGQNVDVGVGSAVDVQADAAYLGELDALTIRNNAAREALGYKTEAESARRRGEIARQEGVYRGMEGRAAQTGSRYAAVGTLLGGAGSIVQAKYGKK